MILADTGPLVALFDPADKWHGRCVGVLKELVEPLCTTLPILTEAFYMLTPSSVGARRLMDFIHETGLRVWFLDETGLSRALELMLRYKDAGMDLADASLVVAAERLKIRKVFTIDRTDFSIYRIQRGHRSVAFEIVG